MSDPYRLVPMTGLLHRDQVVRADGLLEIRLTLFADDLGPARFEV